MMTPGVDCHPTPSVGALGLRIRRADAQKRTWTNNHRTAPENSLLPATPLAKNAFKQAVVNG